MPYNWEYNGINYGTEAEVAQAVSDMKQRLVNNPTDWVAVKEIQAASEGWVLLPNALSDVQINGLDENKMYTVYSKSDGQNFIPLTASETAGKVADSRAVYVQAHSLDSITKFDVEVVIADDGTATPEPDIIPVDLPEYPS